MYAKTLTRLVYIMALTIVPKNLFSSSIRDPIVGELDVIPIDVEPERLIRKD